MEKKCLRCKLKKSLDEFCKDKKQKDNHNKYCRGCCQKYYRSLDNHFRQAYLVIKQRPKMNKKYINRPLTFTFEEFQIFKPQWAELHNAWVHSGYQQALSPSIDRIDNSKGYDLNNIQIITQSENSRKDALGEKTHLAKLTNEKVKKIRELYKKGIMSQKELADKFNTDQANIHYIVRRKTWKHI